MTPLLIVSIVLIFAALCLYTYAVWAEQLIRRLRRPYIVAFWLGFGCDTTGTTLMLWLPSEMSGATVLHRSVGLTAIVLMGLHALWALRVWRRADSQAEALFHRFSRYVYFLWLVAFGTGVWMGMG